MTIDTETLSTDTLTLEQKVGRLILCRIPGYVLEEPHSAALAAGTIGGAVLFKENASNLEQLAHLCAQIVETSKHPPVLTVDQEGGAVQRFDHVITPLPSAMSLGSHDDVEAAKKAASINASQLALLGFNCLLAPVLDVASNPKNPIIGSRAFGSTPEAAIKYGIETARAILNEGVVPVGKHFPGHGSTKEDSHAELAVYEGTAEELENIELKPFKECLDVLPAILTAHIWVKALDKEWRPASLSPMITGELLRRQMGFNKLIMTDDMLMKAITSRYGTGEAAVLAVEAGNDLLLVCGTFEESMEAHKAVVAAVKSGRISQQRLSDSVARIDALFSKRASHADPASSPERFAQLKKSVELNNATVDQLYRVSNVRGSLQLTNDSWSFLLPQHSRYPMNLVGEIEQLKKAGQLHSLKQLQIQECRYKPDLASDDIDRLIDKHYSGGNVLVVTFRAPIMTGQLELARRLMKRKANGSKAILVAGDTAGELPLLSEWTNAASTLDPSNLAFKSLAKELCGL